MRALVARYRYAVKTGQEGWALMDAIWSSVVVMLAFMGTFLALDASTKTATRDIRTSTAYDLAQNELDRLHKIGDTNLPNLLTQDNTDTPPSAPSRTVVLDGVTYSIWDRAFYVQGIGSDTTDACGYSATGAGNTSAQYVYLKVTVTWPGMTGPTGASGASGYTLKPATLDTYFAPEGGDLQTNTGTLRVFVTRIDGDPLAGKTVNLYKMPANVQVGVTQTTNANGCVLFTGLARSDYEIRIPSASEFDLFMTTNPITVPLKIPARATLSRTVKIDFPVTVNPMFVTKTTSGGADVTLTPGAATANSFIGPWVASAPEINRASGDEFVSTTYGFMPHMTAAIANKMFPQTTGYTAFAGPCDINDPGIANRITIPSPSNNATWAPNSTYTGAMTLRLPNFRIALNTTAQNATANTGMVFVRLTDVPNGTTNVGNCGPRSSLFNTWVRLPGKVDASGFLTADAYALPVGEYDICVRQTGTGNGWTGRPEYLYRAAQNNNNFPNPTAVTMDVKTSGGASTATCGTGTGSWT